MSVRGSWCVSGLVCLLFLAAEASAQQQTSSAQGGPTPVAVKPLHPATAPLVRPLYGHNRAIAVTDTYFRAIAVVPLVGSGKKGDPIRPDFVPVHAAAAAYHTGIVAYTQIGTDDRKHAIVEVVATSRAALLPLLNDKRPDVVAFEKGRATKSQMETEFQKHKKGFTLDSFPRAVAR